MAHASVTRVGKKKRANEADLHVAEKSTTIMLTVSLTLFTYAGNMILAVYAKKEIIIEGCIMDEKSF